ncbi:DUF1304 domain-containing protein [Polaribacter haliotis]|uniref:DUF1304 domain-containing protein n=1 Tax=Polaribacter haliotis TaxID=1888915 RepID=A0A7L8AD95_9FLAO|nr:DUF1304 domain-containing protein [Polaribacter haliotis]QOD59965.1 DUF1304 domain-containing protein [Polaribacter haliotis]
MEIIQTVFIILVALIHLYILYLEMALWTTKKGINTFGLKSKEFAEETKIMAANQGLYNGFLALGLLWFLITNNFDGIQFLLICVFIAGLYGAYSTKIIKIFYIQSIPAIIALLLTLLF